MRFHPKTTAVLLSLAIAPFAVHAAELETLSAMHPTNPIDWPTIPQTGAKADQSFLVAPCPASIKDKKQGDG